jgi:hypothetical protein
MTILYIAIALGYWWGYETRGNIDREINLRILKTGGNHES